MNQNETIEDLFREFYHAFEDQALDIGFDQFAVRFNKLLTVLIIQIPFSKNHHREFIRNLKDKVLGLAKAIKEYKKKEEGGLDASELLEKKREEFLKIISAFRYSDDVAIEIYNKYKSKTEKSFGKEKKAASAAGMNEGEHLRKGKSNYSHQIGATAVTPKWANPNAEKIMLGRNLHRTGWVHEDTVKEEAADYIGKLKYLEKNAEKFGINEKYWNKIVDIIINLEENIEEYVKTKFSARLGGLTQDRENASTAKKQLKKSLYVIKKFLVPYQEILKAIEEEIALTIKQRSALGEHRSKSKPSSFVYSEMADSVEPANFQEQQGVFGLMAHGKVTYGTRSQIRDLLASDQNQAIDIIKPRDREFRQVL